MNLVRIEHPSNQIRVNVAAEVDDEELSQGFLESAVAVAAVRQPSVDADRQI